jgi:very-short-patch-repair endonuclease
MSNYKFKQRILNLPSNTQLKQRAKELRKQGVLSEVLFWNEVKRKKILDLDFDRQKIIGNYIVDFYIKKLGIVIEIDGVSHNEKLEEDEIRDNYLKSLGLTVIRYSDLDVKHNLDNVIQDLKNQIITNLVDM